MARITPCLLRHPCLAEALVLRFRDVVVTSYQCFYQSWYLAWHVAWHVAWRSFCSCVGMCFSSKSTVPGFQRGDTSRGAQN